MQLYITPINKPSVMKLNVMASSAVWSETVVLVTMNADALSSRKSFRRRCWLRCAMGSLSRGTILTWYAVQVGPGAMSERCSQVFVAKNMLHSTCHAVDASEFGKDPTCISFINTHCSVRRSDGTVPCVARLQSDRAVVIAALRTRFCGCDCALAVSAASCAILRESNVEGCSEPLPICGRSCPMGMPGRWRCDAACS